MNRQNPAAPFIRPPVCETSKCCRLRIARKLRAPPRRRNGREHSNSLKAFNARQLQALVRRQPFEGEPIRSWTTRAPAKNGRAVPSEISALRPYLAAVPRSLRKIRALE